MGADKTRNKIFEHEHSAENDNVCSLCVFYRHLGLLEEREEKTMMG